MGQSNCSNVSCFAALSHLPKILSSDPRGSDANDGSTAAHASEVSSSSSNAPSKLMQRRNSRDEKGKAIEVKPLSGGQIVNRFDPLDPRSLPKSLVQPREGSPRRHSSPNLGGVNSGPGGLAEHLHGAPALNPSPVDRDRIHLDQNTVSTLVSISQQHHMQGQRRRSAPAALGLDSPAVQASLAHEALRENAPVGVARDKDEMSRRSSSSGALSDINTDDESPGEEAAHAKPKTPPSVTSDHSLREFSTGEVNKMLDVGRNVIFFDWDDTLFPSTWIRQQGIDYTQPCPHDSPLQEPLRQLSSVMVALLETAFELSNVAIVTLSRPPWVTSSVYNFLPDVAKLIAKHNVGVFYAHEVGGPKMVWEPGAGWPSREGEYHHTKNEGQVCEFDTVLKRKGMCKALGEMGHTAQNQEGLMQLMSIGDSMIEHSALQELQYFWSTHNHMVPFTVKTIKLMSEPSIEELIGELSILKVSLERLILLKEDFELEFGVHNNAIKIMKSKEVQASR